MAWNKERATKRIANFIKDVPEGSIAVEQFSQYAQRRNMQKAAGLLQDERAGQIVIPRNRAIETHGVHVYANLMDFNAVLEEIGIETVASHRRALEFLNAHYSACDVLTDEFGLQRVDFHGPRLHAVVLAPEGDSNEAERIRVAILFSAAFRELAAELSRNHPEFGTRVRIGIDSGPAVAINDGTKADAEPLFIGSPANKAAKLADGDDPGIYFSDRAEHARAGGSLLNVGPLHPVTETEVLAKYRRSSEKSGTAPLIRDAYERVEARLIKSDKVIFGSQPAFAFRHKEPPLSTIRFKDHPPSNAIRMEVASIFADIDGFTAYIDAAIVSGTVAQAVANLFVIRRELAAVLQEDFRGRKVRYIGDCLHGIIAEGDVRQTDTNETINQSVLTLGALRSSFELCKAKLVGLESLGIAIGTDIGETPICRIGLRGEASVRIAVSRATCHSENEQRRCDGSQSAIGQKAYAAASVAIRRQIGGNRIIDNLDYLSAQMMLGIVPEAAQNLALAEPNRSHGKTNTPQRSYSR
jgi:class 3 adenylate cyclase